jgi:hypothetical protein
MPLQVRAFGLAVGLVWGVIILGVSLLVTIKGAGGEHLSRLGLLYPGYRVTYSGYPTRSLGSRGDPVGGV